MAEGKEFLGAGIAFPCGVDSGGQLAMSSLEDHVRQSILLILRTGKGERVMLPDFGARLDTLVFSEITPATAVLIQHQVTQALTRFEPRIDLLAVTVSLDQAALGVLPISIEYRVRRTD